MGKKILFQSKYCATFITYGNASSAEASDFITATGISDSTQISAIRELVNNFIGYGLWSKTKAIYPMVGGSATSHKYNLKDPRDLDAAFRLVFFGTWIHSATGAKPDGSTGYANTKLSPSIVLTDNSSSLFYYNRGGTINYDAIGCGLNGNTNVFRILIYPTQSTFDNGNISCRLSLNVPTTGAFSQNRTSSTSFFAYRNGKIIGKNTTLKTESLSSVELFINAYSRSGVAVNFANTECAFAGVGGGMTKCEMYYYYKAVQLFQTQLSRQI